MPGAFPYFGAIDQIMRAGLSPTGSLLTLTYYNLIFLIPLSSLLFVRVLLPSRSQAIFQRVSQIAVA